MGADLNNYTVMFLFLIIMLGVDSKVLLAGSMAVLLLQRTVQLLYFVKSRMNSKYGDAELNTELCKFTYLLTCLDCTMGVWVIVNSFFYVEVLKQENGGILIMGLINYVAVPETVALIIGRQFGRNNFSYFISPKKTIEGLIGQYLGIGVSVMINELHCYLLPSLLTRSFSI